LCICLAWAARAEVELPQGTGKEAVEHACQDCHALEVATRFRLTKERWGFVVADMVFRGAAVAAEDIDPVIEYLAKNFGRPSPPPSAPSAEPEFFFASLLEERRPGPALDIGMGQGREALFLARQGWTVTGLDSYAPAVVQVRAIAKNQGLSLEAVVSRFEKFDAGDEAWDLIVMTDLPHPDPAGAARLLRGLKPAGLFVYENHYSFGSPPDLLLAFPGVKVIHSKADPHLHLERVVLEKPVE
jgi:SAM-dependent methyltransferase